MLTDSPFSKVEASKFTEVGYVGRDVESMVRDLLELTVNKGKGREQEAVKGKASQIAEERMLDLLLPKSEAQHAAKNEDSKEVQIGLITPASEERSSTREKLRAMLRRGKLDERYVDLDVTDRNLPMVEIFSNVGMEEMGINFKDMLGGMFPKGTKRRKVKVKEERIKKIAVDVVNGYYNAIDAIDMYPSIPDDYDSQIRNKYNDRIESIMMEIFEEFPLEDIRAKLKTIAVNIFTHDIKKIKSSGIDYLDEYEPRYSSGIVIAGFGVVLSFVVG